MVYSVTAAGETDNIYLGNLLVAKDQPGTGSWTDMIYGGGNLIARRGVRPTIG